MQTEYVTVEAEVFFAQLKFEQLPNEMQRTRVRQSMVAMLRTFNKTVRDNFEVTATDGTENGISWQLRGGYCIEVVVDPTPTQIVVHVKRTDRPVKERTTILDYNVLTEILESRIDKPFTPPGVRPERRNALDVVAEQFVVALRDNG